MVRIAELNQFKYPNKLGNKAKKSQNFSVCQLKHPPAKNKIVTMKFQAVQVQHKLHLTMKRLISEICLSWPAMASKVNFLDSIPSHTILVQFCPISENVKIKHPAFLFFE